MQCERHHQYYWYSIFLTMVHFSKDFESRKLQFQILTDHYGETKTDCYVNNTISAVSIINKVQAEVRYENFKEEPDADGAMVPLNIKVKEDVKKLVPAKKLTSDEVENYMQSSKPMSTDIYKSLAADETLKNYSKIVVLFQISLLIPPSTSNVERGFSELNLQHCSHFVDDIV